MLAAALATAALPWAAASPPALSYSWATFLARADVSSSWSRPSGSAAWALPGPPLTYDTAAFLGNGNVGAMLQATANGSVTLVLGASAQSNPAV